MECRKLKSKKMLGQPPNKNSTDDNISEKLNTVGGI